MEEVPESDIVVEILKSSRCSDAVTQPHPSPIEAALVSRTGRCIITLHVLYNPIQLLRPPGLCRLVCPIFTSLSPGFDSRFSLVILRSIDGISTASI